MSHVGPFFQEMEEYISESRIAVASGREIDLHGLNLKIESLCNMILDLSPDDQRLYEERLQDLLTNLNTLGVEMKAQFETLDLLTHRQANIAYKTADSRDNFGKRGDDGEKK